MAKSKKSLLRLARFYPPFFGSGIKVTNLAPDDTSITVQHKVTKLNNGIFGTAFGGILSMMADPFFAILTSYQLGSKYKVWDSEGHIKYFKPGKGVLTCKMDIPKETVEKIRQEAQSGEKVLTWFSCDIVDSENDIVATVDRQVYVRKK